MRFPVVWSVPWWALIFLWPIYVLAFLLWLTVALFLLGFWLIQLAVEAVIDIVRTLKRL